jgi:hypothetical protein
MGEEPRVGKPMSDSRMRELIDFVFGERLRRMREREQVEASRATTPPPPPSRKRKRANVVSIEDDEEAEEEEERQRLRRRRLAPQWMPRRGSLPLLTGDRAHVLEPWESDIHQVAITHDGQTVMQWSHSNGRNEHPRSADVMFVGGFEFPTQHYYIVDGLRGGYISVSGFLHDFYHDFDAMRFEKAAQCLRATSEKSPYFFMTTTQEVFDYWDKIRDNGTCYHAAIDDTLQGRPLRPVYQVGKSDAIYGPPPGFARFMVEHPDLEVHWTEFTVFDRVLVLVGQFDALFWDKRRQCFILVDWKNVKTFRTSATEKGTDPLTANEDDCHKSHYSLQMNLYRGLLERRYGIRIAEMWIVNFPAFQTKGAPYEIYPVERRNMAPFFARCPRTPEGRSRQIWAPTEPHKNMMPISF